MVKICEINIYKTYFFIVLHDIFGCFGGGGGGGGGGLRCVGSRVQLKFSTDFSCWYFI